MSTVITQNMLIQCYLVVRTEDRKSVISVLMIKCSWINFMDHILHTNY